MLLYCSYLFKEERRTVVLTAPSYMMIIISRPFIALITVLWCCLHRLSVARIRQCGSYSDLVISAWQLTVISRHRFQSYLSD